MKKLLSLFLTIFFPFLISFLYSGGVILPAYQVNQKGSITAEEVVVQYLKAIGGTGALKKINTKTIRYRVHMFARDGYVMERLWTRPNSMKTGAPGAAAYMKTEGEKSWRVTSGEHRELPVAISANLIKLADIDGPLVDFTKKGISLEYLGTEHYDMTNLHHLKLTFKDGIQTEAFTSLWPSW